MTGARSSVRQRPACRTVTGAPAAAWPRQATARIAPPSTLATAAARSRASGSRISRIPAGPQAGRLSGTGRRSPAPPRRPVPSALAIASF